MHIDLKVVELLIKSSLCDGLLKDTRDITADKMAITPLHLAARGGHTSIIRYVCSW